MGRISRLHPGKDGEVRVAQVKTEHGYLQRPLQRLFPLEVSTSESLPVPEVVKEVAVAKKKKQQEIEPEIKSAQTIHTRSGRRVKRPVRYET